MSLTELACKRVQELTPYQSARRIGGKGRIYLNANENPLSLNYELDSSSYNRYPDCQPEEVLEAYANYAKVTSEQVLVSRGSDEAIGLLIRTFCEVGTDQILICPPTYGMYSIAAETNGVDVIKVAPREDFQPDVPAIKNALDQNSIKVIFFCSPNNPTGTLIDPKLLREVLDYTQGKSIVVVDEAYIEFKLEASMIELLKEYKNLVITRTLSKAFGLAGLRCGFTIADPEIIKLLLKVIDPYPICSPVAQVATAALQPSNIEIIKKRVTMLNDIRTKFEDQVSKLSFVKRVYPSNGNYSLIEFSDGEKLFNYMKEQGIILRDFNDKPRLANCVRITIGTSDEMDQVLQAMESFQA